MTASKNKNHEIARRDIREKIGARPDGSDHVFSRPVQTGASTVGEDELRNYLQKRNPKAFVTVIRPDGSEFQTHVIEYISSGHVFITTFGTFPNGRWVVDPRYRIKGEA